MCIIFYIKRLLNLQKVREHYWSICILKTPECPLNIRHYYYYFVTKVVSISSFLKKCIISRVESKIAPSTTKLIQFSEAVSPGEEVFKEITKRIER